MPRRCSAAVAGSCNAMAIYQVLVDAKAAETSATRRMIQAGLPRHYRAIPDLAFHRSATGLDEDSSAIDLRG
jgi:hypothetical protein